MNIPLKFHDRREEGDSVLRQSQLVQLHLLYVLDAVCRELKLSYVLDGGTLLGAMRHDGFIPWDDDLDVGMPRKDYDRFLKEGENHLPADVILQTQKSTPDRMLGLSKLHDAYSFYAEQSRGVSMTHPNGIFIDIFPYDELPTRMNGLFRIVLGVCQKSLLYAKALRVSGGRGWTFSLFGGWLSLPLYAFHYVVKWLLELCTFFVPPENRNTHYGFDAWFTYGYSNRHLYPIAHHVFEDGEFPVPADSDKVLQAQYGDWRKLPPEAERQGGHGKLVLPFQAIMVSGAMKW